MIPWGYKAPIPGEMVSSRFSGFNIVDVYYKWVKSTPIPVTILIPKNIERGKHPLLVRWHGGCFITGHRMYPEWFGRWILDFALSKGAVIVSPDYRLMPEAKGLDLYADLSDFYTWLQGPRIFDGYLPRGSSADLAHILVSGESAGGWFALQSCRVPAVKEKISAVICHYPMIDLQDPQYTGNHQKRLFNPPVPQIHPSVLAQYVHAMMEEDRITTSGIPPDREPLVISFLQQGAFKDYFGDEPSLYPLEWLPSMERMPPTWIFHGTADSVIPVEGTHKYEEYLKRLMPDSKLLVHYARDADHGFDNDPSVNLETSWIKEGLDFVQTYWPHR